MNTNLPEIKKDSIFIKFKKWFKRLFGIEETVQDAINDINSNVEEIKKTEFKQQLQAESKDSILALQRRLKEKQIEISELTDEELDEMIELYKNQINTKKEKLKKYKNKINN